MLNSSDVPAFPAAWLWLAAGAQGSSQQTAWAAIGLVKPKANTIAPTTAFTDICIAMTNAPFVAVKYLRHGAPCARADVRRVRWLTSGRDQRTLLADPWRELSLRRLGSALAVLVVAAPPDAGLVAPLGGAVEPLVHAPEAVHSARIGGIGVVDDAVLEHERAHARPVARVCGRVGSAHGREVADRLRGGVRVHGVAGALVVVFDAPLALLVLGERDVEVEVEVAIERGRPRKRPPHPPLVRLQLRERRPRHCRKADVVVRQVNGEAVEPVRDRRAGRTPRRVVGPEHEVVDEELRAPSEEVLERGAPFIGLETVVLVEADPRQLLAPLRQLVAAPCELLLRLEQLEPRCQPLLTRPGRVSRHRSSPLVLGGRETDRCRASNGGSDKCGGIRMEHGRGPRARGGRFLARQY